MNSETRDLILLNAIPSFGYQRLKDMLERFGTTSGILDSKQPDIIRAGKIFDIDKEIETVKKEKIKITTILDADYPEILKRIYSPPIVLYTRGCLDINNEKTIAIVGCRKCTQYGISMARRICRYLAEFRITTVSGMARGIDTAAHRASIEFGGETIAVLGSGLMNIYPPENTKLSKDISQKGLLMSEFPLYTPPLKENFPRRNRVISGLSRGVVVIEAAKESGALITSDFALEQGRDVFAVPGNAASSKSEGCHKLIKQGAKLAEDAFDIIDEVFPEMLVKLGERNKTQKDEMIEQVSLNIADEEKKIYQLLSSEPTGIDTLTETLNMNTPQILSGLLNLEIKGFARQLPGKLYIRK
ncbi:MAG: DNA-processing protein DprA [Candidatus Omnitrophica bacterium]|nr:DNA-processing protein DprA [Candidatus Omnitrophota bacterium]